MHEKNARHDGGILTASAAAGDRSMSGLQMLKYHNAAARPVCLPLAMKARHGSGAGSMAEAIAAATFARSLGASKWQAARVRIMGSKNDLRTSRPPWALDRLRPAFAVLF
jgi:hypothetical protein